MACSTFFIHKDGGQVTKGLGHAAISLQDVPQAALWRHVAGSSNYDSPGVPDALPYKLLFESRNDQSVLLLRLAVIVRRIDDDFFPVSVLELECLVLRKGVERLKGHMARIITPGHGETADRD